MNKNSVISFLAVVVLLLLTPSVSAQTAFRKAATAGPTWGTVKQPSVSTQQSLSNRPFFQVKNRRHEQANPLHRSHAAGQHFRMPKAFRPTAPRPAMLASTSDGTQLWGNVIFSDEWDEYLSLYGLYSLDATAEGINSSELLVDNELWSNGGGVFIDDVFHCVQYDVDGWGGLYAYYLKYDTRDWYRITDDLVDISDRWDLMARCTAVDPTTNTIYGIFSTVGGYGTEFGTVDYNDFSRTTIAPVDLEILAMACNLTLRRSSASMLRSFLWLMRQQQ